MELTLRRAACLLIFVSILAAPSLFGAKKVKAPGKSVFDAPTISCAATSSGATIGVIVTAGPSGAPAGFSIHWSLRSEETSSDCGDDDDNGGDNDDDGDDDDGGASDDDGDDDDNGGDSDDDGDDDDNGGGGCGASNCEASFSGNARGHYYALDPGESVTIQIGERFTIPGASSKCNAALKCGEQYAFRVFAHATSDRKRSDWSATTYCSTRSCAGGGGGGSGCTQTKGFFAITGPSSGETLWPVMGLTLGNVFYTNLQLELILNTPSTGTGLIELAQQLITAKLNVANGASGGDIDAKITAADAAIGSRIVPPIGTGSVTSATASVHITALRDFNQGAVGPGSCE